MATKTTNTILRNAITVFSGTGGATAGTPVGFLPSAGGVNVTTTFNAEDLTVEGEDLPQEVLSRIKGMTFQIPLLQFDVELGGLAWGVTPDGSVNTFGDPTVDVRLPKKSWAIVGTDAAGTTKRYDMPWGASAGDVSQDLGQETTTITGLEIRAVAPTTGAAYPTWTQGSGNIEATLATGVLTRTAAYHKIRSEVAFNADILDSISAGAADNDLLTLQIARVDEPITFTHLNGTLELFGDADFVMTKLSDLMVLQWDLGATTWDEIRRIDDPN